MRRAKMIEMMSITHCNRSAGAVAKIMHYFSLLTVREENMRGEVRLRDAQVLRSTADGSRHEGKTAF